MGGGGRKENGGVDEFKYDILEILEERVQIL
jgi:hypothetical protein